MSWSSKELEKLKAIVERASVNYVTPKLTPHYPTIEAYKKNSMSMNGFKPSELPTESTIFIGAPLVGKTFLLKCWEEVLKNRIEKIIFKFKNDDYSREFHETWLEEYNKDLSLNSYLWIDEKKTNEFFADYENQVSEYKRLIFKKYFFLDDLFFNRYDFNSEKKTTQNFISFQENLFRFLELNKNIIVIATTNNIPEVILEGDFKKTILSRYNAIFKNKIFL